MSSSYYSSESLSTSSKRARSSRPKVRSGCVTCKARRVKCDETKPACDRCSKFGRRCGGYAQTNDFDDETPESSSRSEHRNILPMHLSRGSHVTSAVPAPNEFEMDLSLSLHQNFCVEISRELCGILETPEWTGRILHECQDFPFIQYAVIAMGVLSRGAFSNLTNAIQQSAYGADIALPLLSEDRQYALLNYDRFLEGSRESVSYLGGASTAARSHHVLLFCILTICLESLQFHHDQALSQIQMGLNLIYEWHRAPASTQPFEQEAVPALGEYEEEIVRIFQILEGKVAFMESLPRQQGQREQSHQQYMQQQLQLPPSERHSASAPPEFPATLATYFYDAAAADDSTMCSTYSGYMPQT